jgi:hypothetical protein
MNVNKIAFRPFSRLKSALVPSGRKPLRVRWGLYSGLTLHLDLAHETQIYLGLWERETYRFIRSALSSCCWLIDIGSAKGELGILLATQPNVTKVIACEPLASEIDVFKRNQALNKVAMKVPIEIVQKYVGTADRPDTVRLDHLDVDRTRRGLIKIDVDGAEMDVLHSGRKLLEARVAALLVETHSETLERECGVFLASCGYRCCVIRNAWWRTIVPEKRPSEHNRWLWARPRSAAAA